MFRSVLTPCLAAVLATSFAATSHADDTALYAEPAPADAAFVRFIGFASGTVVDFAGVRFEVPRETATSYVAVSSARLSDVAVGAYVSVLPGEGDAAVRRIDEPARDSRSKVHLLVLNASAEPVHLSTVDGAMQVVGAVAPGQSASRAVNPVSVSLGLFGANDQALGSYDVTLRRGQNLSFVVDANGATVIENSFGPVLK